MDSSERGGTRAHRDKGAKALKLPLVFAVLACAACGGTSIEREVIYVGSDAGPVLAADPSPDAGSVAVDASASQTLADASDAGATAIDAAEVDADPPADANASDADPPDAGEDAGADAGEDSGPACQRKVCYPGQCGLGLDGCGGALDCGNACDSGQCVQCPGTSVSMCGGACD